MKEKLLKKRMNFRSNIFMFEYIIFVFVIFISAFSALRFPKEASKGVYDGLMLCFKNVVPSLFPFMIVSSLIAQSDVTSKLSKVFSPVMRVLFRQPAQAFSVVILSQIGGFPVGASLVNQLYDKGALSSNEAKRLMIFCINPGPAFVISYIGSALLNSAKAGTVIYFSVVLSSLIIGFCTRFFSDGFISGETKKDADFISPSETLVKSVKKSSISMFGICSWVVVFSCAGQLLSLLPLSESEQIFLSIVLEVTNGCKNAAQALPIYAIAGAVGWCGVCVHFQVMDTIIKIKLKLKYFLAARIINASVAIIISYLLFQLFPVYTAAANVKSELVPSSSGITISVCLIVMCFLVIVGDQTIVVKRKKEFAKLK